MAVVTIQDVLVAQTADALGNTGWFQTQAKGYFWSFTFFNNSSHTQYIQINPDVGSAKAVKIPASTSFDMTIADLILDQIKTIRILGTSTDSVTMVLVDNPVPAAQVFLGPQALSLLGLTAKR